MDLALTNSDKMILRELARRQQEYAQLPIMKERESRWYRHNDLQGEIPMINFETWTCESELLDPLECETEAGREMELQIRREILNHERVDDDRVVSPDFTIPWNLSMLLFDLEIEVQHAKDSEGRSIGYHHISPIADLSTDMHLLKPTTYGVDREGTLAWKALVEETLGDILPVQMGMRSFVCCLSQHMVHLMGMENMMMAMMMTPDEFHEIMGRMTKDYITYFKWMESEGLLFPNNGNDWLCQGSFGFTNDLPTASDLNGRSLKTTDLWGYMDSQETVGVDPAMFHEFFFPYYLEVAKCFGMLSYGCCEPVHSFWEQSLCQLPNLRKISISPWCDEQKMGEILQGAKTIYHRKPSPNFIGVGKEFDEAGFRAHIRDTLEAAQGCKLEISFRDIYTLEHDRDKPRRAIQIVREEIDAHWRG